VVLAGRATSVPFTTVITGFQRTTTGQRQIRPKLRRSPLAQVKTLPDLALGARGRLTRS